jgi:hypothetical protein
MQKRLWGVSAAALALTCLTVTGCGTAQHASPSTHPLAAAQTTSSASAKSQIASIVVSHSQIRTPINQPVRISGQVLNSQHEVIPNAKLSVVGLPDSPSGYTVRTNTQGEFHLTTQWPHPGKYTIAIGDGKRSIDISVQVVPSSTVTVSSSVAAHPSVTSKSFSGMNVQLVSGLHVSSSIPNGYTDKQTGLTYSNTKFQTVEEFTGTLKGKSFMLDFYREPSDGIAVGVSYDHRPVYFGWGPAPQFNILNFTGSDVVLGSPAAGAYLAIDLISGQLITKTEQVVALKGYQGLQPPKDILGLPGSHYSIRIPH